MKARITVTYSVVMDIGELSFPVIQELVEDDGAEFSIWDAKAPVKVESVEVGEVGS